jgi:hypothetical protein
MEIEEIVRSGVLDQDHLADLLLGHECMANEIRSRIVELIEQGKIELYTYENGGNAAITLEKAQALSIAKVPEHWSWRSASGKEQFYFLGPVKLSNGSLAYGG